MVRNMFWLSRLGLDFTFLENQGEDIGDLIGIVDIKIGPGGRRTLTAPCGVKKFGRNHSKTYCFMQLAAFTLTSVCKFPFPFSFDFLCLIITSLISLTLILLLFCSFVLNVFLQIFLDIVARTNFYCSTLNHICLSTLAGWVTSQNTSARY